MESSTELNENGDDSPQSVAGATQCSTRRRDNTDDHADAAAVPPPHSNRDAGDRTSASLTVAERDYLEHMEGMSELRATMRLRPLRVRCQKFVELLSLDDSHQQGNNATMPLPPNTKVVHLVRHGQGFHNLMAELYHDTGRTWTQFVASPDNPYTRIELTDSPLTEVGRKQAMALQPLVKGLCEMRARPQIVLSSPQTRALQTALLAFEPLLKESDDRGRTSGAPDESHRRVPFVAHEMLREETGVHVCDQRRPASSLVRDFGAHFDFGLLPEHDELFQETRRETKEEVGDRAYRFLEWLEARPEQHVAVSSHSAWLLTLLNGVCDCDDPSVEAWFQTGEMRSVVMHFVRTSP